MDKRKETLNNFADGVFPEQVFGIDRLTECIKLCSWLNGIKPTPDERMVNAFNESSSRKILAYDRGVKWVREAYWDYSHVYLL